MTTAVRPTVADRRRRRYFWPRHQRRWVFLGSEAVFAAAAMLVDDSAGDPYLFLLIGTAANIALHWPLSDLFRRQADDGTRPPRRWGRPLDRRGEHIVLAVLSASFATIEWGVSLAAIPGVLVWTLFGVWLYYREDEDGDFRPPRRDHPR